METTILTYVSISKWRALLSITAFANLAVLLFMGVAQRDSLALALGAVLVAGIALLNFRRGLLGALLLGLLYADIAIWTVSGALNNFIHQEQGMTLLLPSFLGVISMTGLAAAAGVVLNRRRLHEESRLAALVGGFGLGLLLLVAFSSLLVPPQQVQIAQGTELRLGNKNMLYSDMHLTASTGEITLNLDNEDLWWHTFSVDELGLDLHVPMGAVRSVTFEAPPGEYRFYCSIPGHDIIGMHGTLVVTE